jgi:nitrite reductase/ring-hydroxylating ferredoxin subunit
LHLIPVLIPGATYRLTDGTAMKDPCGPPVVRKEFRVKSGETLDLGDIRIEKPQ